MPMPMFQQGLFKLHQTWTVREYYQEFDLITSAIDCIPLDTVEATFVKVLWPEINAELIYRSRKVCQP